MGGKEMSEDKSKKFQWDDKALVPDTWDVTFPTEVTGGDPVQVIHYELNRTDLVDFVAEGTDNDFMRPVLGEDGKPVLEEDGTPRKVRAPFKEISNEQAALLWKYMAKSSRGAQTVEFYTGLQLGSNAMLALVDAFMNLNHIDEIMASGGNWFMLPTVRVLLSAEAKPESDKSESPKPTLVA